MSTRCPHCLGEFIERGEELPHERACDACAGVSTGTLRLFYVDIVTPMHRARTYVWAASLKHAEDIVSDVYGVRSKYVLAHLSKWNEAKKAGST